MDLRINDTAPDFNAKTTEGEICLGLGMRLFSCV